MSTILSRAAYADMFGPTTGDRVRLADTALIIEIEKDFTTYGEEVKFGGSQIVSPDGEVVARAGAHAPEVVFADVDLSRAEDKRIGADDLFAIRRPTCYGLLARRNPMPAPAAGLASLGVAALQPDCHGAEALGPLEQSWREASAAGATLMVLPELCAHARGEPARDPAAAARRDARWLAHLATIARETASWGVFSGVEEADGRFHHSAWLIDPHGRLAARYRQVHVPAALRSWAAPGDALPVFETAIGRIGLLCGADLLVPEAFRVLARQGAELVAVCGAWRGEQEIRWILPERAAENRINIVLARRADSAVARGSAIIGALPYPSEPHWRVRSPDVLEAPAGAPWVMAAANLAASRDKTVGPQGCDLMASALPEAYGLLAEPMPGPSGPGNRPVPGALR